VRRNRTPDGGQASVELALVLPLVALLLVALLQAGLLLRDQLLMVHAAREGAREAAVTPDPARIRAAAGRAAPGLTLEVHIRRGARPGDLTTVRVSARPGRLPLVGAALGNHRLAASATMRVERAGS
jgi:Flp pilus assembly protein TadG